MTAIDARALEILQQQIGSLMVTLAQRTAELEAARRALQDMSEQRKDVEPILT